MADSWMESAALADLRALLPMVRHHVAMLSSPATAGQNARAGMELAELATTMAALCAECGITDCAQLLDALHAALAQAPIARNWSSQFAAATLEAFGYALHRIGTLGTETINSPDTSGQHAIVARLIRALEKASQPEAMRAAPWDGDGETLADVFADDDTLFGDDPPAEPPNLTDDEREMLASYQSATLRVTMPPTPQIFAPDSPAASLPRTSLAGSGWAPGPFDVLADELFSAPEPEQATNDQVPWRLPTTEELDEIPEEMKRLFLVETEEDLQSLRVALSRYEQHPDDPSGLHAIGRITHKIKGTAATLGFDVLAAVTHHYEDLIKALLTRRMEAGPQANAALLRGLVLLQESLEASDSGQAPGAALASEAAALLDGAPHPGDAAPSTHSPAPLAMGVFGPSAQASTSAGQRESTPPTLHSDENESSLRVEVRRLDELMQHLSALAINRATLLQTRDDIVQQQSEMDASLARLSDLSTQLADLQPRLRHAPGASAEGPARRGYGGGGDRAAGLGISGNLEHSGLRRGGLLHAPNVTDTPRWDELELESDTEFDSALRALNEVVGDMLATSRELRASLLRLSLVSEDQAGLATRMQRDVMHVRLVPLSDIVTRLDFEVKVLAGLTGKSVTFSVSGEMTEIDRNISEALREPLLQLVRNAVVHGIESPEERTESGKPATGTAWVHAYYAGSEVIVEVGDDGQGINSHKLAASAVYAKILDSETARALSPAEALDLMFWPGVTTFGEPMAVSGRGIGLDEVRTAIEKLKGAITVRSEPGKGSVFRVRVPISLSVVHALHVLAGGQSFAVPFGSVKRTLSLNASEMLVSTSGMVGMAGTTYGDASIPATQPTQSIRIEREDTSSAHGEVASQAYDEIPVFALATLLGLAQEPHNPQPALLIEAGRQRVAFLVDGVFEEQEVVVQTLPRPLQRRAVRGASVTASGQVLLLLDLPELAVHVLDGSQKVPPPRPRPVSRFPDTLAPRVLVVDDSVTIRQTLEHILRRGGFEVQVARDGIEALETMLTSVPRVVVLDIEMPRLDGFEVLSILRRSPQLNDVRVVMLTSRAADKHKEHALRLGAQAYLIKPCPQETLLETVRGLLTEPVPGIQ